MTEILISEFGRILELFSIVPWTKL